MEVREQAGATERSAVMLSESAQRQILDLLPGPVLVSVDDAIVFANPAALEVFGVADLDTLRAREAARQHVMPADVVRIEERLARVARGEPVEASVEYRIVRPDGSIRVVSWTTLPITLRGQHARVYAVDDITELARTRDALAASERHQRAVVAALTEGLIVLDRHGICTDANPAAIALLKLRSPGALVGKRADTIALVDEDGMPIPDRERPVRRVLERGEVVRNEVVTVRSGRQLLRMRVSVLPLDVDGDGNPGGAVLTLDDVTRELEMRQELRDSETQFRLLAERSQDVVMRVTFEPLRFDYLSPAVATLTGRTPEDLYAEPGRIARHIHPDDVERVLAPLACHEFVEHQEFRVVHVDGTIRSVDARSSTILDGGRPVGFEATFRDVTEVAAERALLEQLAHRDALTGLLNRRALITMMDVRLAARSATSVLFCDLDGFKQINDEHGHDVGDRVLVVVAQRITAAVRDSDVVARFAGDEFVVLAGPAHADSIASRLLAVLAAPIVVDRASAPAEVSVGVSIGITHVDLTASHLRTEEVVRRADQAMYEAKRRGKGCVVTDRV